MNGLLPYWDATTAMLRRDWLMFISYRTQFISQILSTFLALALFYYISRLIKFTSIGSSDVYFAYVVVGMTILQTLQSTMGVAMTLRSELVAGTFERILLSPFGAVMGAVSMMVFPFVQSLVSAVMVLGFGALVFGLNVQWGTAALAIPIATLGTGAFAAFGMVFAASTVLFKRVLGGAALIMTGVSLVSGLYFPVSLLPDAVRWLSQVQPFTPAVNLLRHVLIGYPLQDSAWVEVAKVAGFVVVMLPLGIVLLRAALKVGQRTGTIIEY
jgi:ABC-2 type transport system permease protein